jgi:hypothetical protein
MKIFLMTLILSYMLMASNALEEANKLGVESDYATALAKAQKEKKLLVMVIVKEDCRWCEKLINKTLSKEKVKKELKKYITVIVDKDAKFPSEFSENFFPSIFYIDHVTQKSVYSNVGYVGIKCFLNDLNSSEEILQSLYNKK